MGYPKYEEDNRENIQDRQIPDYGRWYDAKPPREEYVPYTVRYQIPEVKVRNSRKVRYAYYR